MLILAVLYLGYSTIRTLNGNPLSMPKAKKIANEYLNQAYPDNKLIISDGTYNIKFGNYYFDIKGSSDTNVNELVIQEGLKTIEDTNKTKELNEKVKQYITANSNLSFEKMEVNGTVFFTSDNFKRNDNIWIGLSGEDLTNEKIANFGKSIMNWSKENGLSLNRLTIDFTNLTFNESFRLTLEDNKLDEQDIVNMIKKTE
ncbi:YfjL-like protein [Paenibacillus swuensis]